MVTLSRIPKGPKPWPSQKHEDFPDYVDMDVSNQGGIIDWHPREMHLVRYVGAVLQQIGSSSTENSEPGQSPISAVYADAASRNSHIVVNPNVLNGKPCLKGTRTPVNLVLRYLAVDDDPTEDLDITRKDVADCLQFAAIVCDQPLRHGD